MKAKIERVKFAWRIFLAVFKGKDLDIILELLTVEYNSAEYLNWILSMYASNKVKSITEEMKNNSVVVTFKY